MSARRPPPPAADERGALSPPRLSWRGAALAAAGWTGYSALYAALITSSAGVPFGWALGGQLAASVILAVYSVPFWYLIVRRLDEAGWGIRLAAHVVAAPVYAWAGLTSYLAAAAWVWGTEAAGAIAAPAVWIWFSSVMLYAIQFALYHSVREARRARFQERRAAELKALANEAELSALKAQVNPHFLFNTLNSISAAAGEDPGESREMVAALAALLRYALSSARRQSVPLADEFTFTRDYLGLEKHRFSDRLRPAFHVDPDVLQTPVPPMVLQPLVDNAVKHGMGRAAGPVAVTVTAERVPGGGVRVCVEDDAAPARTAAAPSFGIGLSNTDARLRACFGPAAGLEAGAIAPRGFRVSFVVPAAYASPEEGGATLPPAAPRATGVRPAPVL